MITDHPEKKVTGKVTFREHPLKNYLTVNDLSKMIGRSPGAIRNLVLRRRIPYRKPAGRLLFLAEEIDRWIDQAVGVRVEDLEGGSI